MLRRLVPILLIVFVAASAFGAAEVAVSDFALRTAGGTKRLPSIAAGDGGYLAAWLDGRSGGYTLFAARLSPTGEPLDPFAIPLARAAYFRPQIVWNGDGYLVFWNDNESNLLVTHVSRDGIAQAPRVLREHARLDRRQRAVAANGSHVVLAYSGGGAMRVAVMTREAVVIDDRIIDARNGWGPTVIANGPQFLVAWNVAGSNEQVDFVALRLDSRGAAIDASPRKIGEGPDADILRNGSDYVALAQKPYSRSWRVSADLAQIGEAAPLPVNHYDRAPSLLDGSPAMLAIFEWSGKMYVTAVSFDDSGHEAGPRKRIVESQPSHFAVARGDAGLAMIEVKQGEDYREALIGNVFDDATLSRKGPERALALSAGTEDTPVIAGGGGRYLAVWDGPRGLTAGRFLPDGTRFDGDGFVLASASGSPAVVFDGERFVVSSRPSNPHGAALKVRFVSPEDGLLPDVLTVGPPAYFGGQTSLAVGGGVVLATWMVDGGGEGVYAAALRGTQVIAPARRIAASDGGRPAAKWNGRHFLVVWNETDWDRPMPFPARLMSMRLESDLTPVDAQPRPLIDGPLNKPVLAVWKDGWLLAFEHGSDIRLHEIDANGTMNGMPLISMAGFSPRFVNAVSHPWLAWTSFGENTMDRVQDARLLRVTAVRSDGTLGPAALSITAPPFGDSFGYHSELGALGNDVAAAYSRVVPEAGSVRRAFISVAKGAPGRRRAVR